MSRVERARHLALTGLLYAGVLVAAAHDEGLSFLYIVPIAIVGMQFGRRAGVLAAGLAAALFGMQAAAASGDTRPSTLVVHGVVYVLAGLLTGRQSDRLRGALKAAEAGARHFELAKDMLCTATADGWFLSLNGSWEQTLGWAESELRARPFVEFVHPDDRETTEREAARLLTGEATVSFTNRYATRDGGWRWLEWSSRSDRPDGPIYAAARDVTARREAEDARRAAERRFFRAFEDSAVGMAIVGVDGDAAHRVLEANEALGRMLGLRPADLVGTRSLGRIADPTVAAEVGAQMRALHDGLLPVCRTELELTRDDGRSVWIDLTASIVRDDDGAPMYRLSQLIDVTARKQAEQRLRALADRDPLSGLFNRRRFAEELDADRDPRVGSRPGALLLLDVDHFKGINDRFGHQVGDEALRTVAGTVTRRLRAEDVVARFGGDEFAVLLRDVSPEQAFAVAESVRSTTAAALHEVLPETALASVSIGVAPFCARGDLVLDELVAEADAALYDAKAAGRNCVAVAAAACAVGANR